MPEAGQPGVPARVAPTLRDRQLPPEINARVAHSSRVYDYWLGGKDNFAADRELGDALTEKVPSTPFAARANRDFLGRAVRYLAGEAGIRQFLDIGTGIPTAGNTHEVAQAAVPESRVVYVDHDPIVLAHARALMTSSQEGATAFIMADLRDPGRILADPELRGTLDLGRPVALMLVAVLHFLTGQDDPHGLVAELMAALPSGSYLTITQLTADFNPEEAAAALESIPTSGVTYVPRSEAGFAAFFDGLDLVDPGVVPLLAWRPDGRVPRDKFAARMYAAMGRKP
jgi:hypothetical protein